MAQRPEDFEQAGRGEGRRVDAKKAGRWNYKWPNGKKRAEGEYVDGKIHGAWIIFNNLGQKREVRQFKGGKRHGISHRFHEDGWLENEVEFVDGRLEGRVRDWRWDKKKKQRYKYREATNRNGRLNGVATTYHANGKVEVIGQYKNSSRHGHFKLYKEEGYMWSEGKLEYGSYEGLWTFWRKGKDGKVYRYLEGTYRRNVREGKWCRLYPNGITSSEGPYFRDKEHGEWVFYHENGRIRERGSYRNGSWTGVWKRYTKEGRLVSKGATIDNKKHGKWTVYQISKPGGKLVEHRTGTYVEGLRHGQWKFFAEDGSLARYGEYYLDQAHGIWTALHPNGKRKNHAEYDYGVMQGTWKKWHDNGQLEETGIYKRGQFDGKQETWYRNGQRRSVGTYVNNAAEGVWSHWHENGKLASSGEWQAGLKTGEWTYYNDTGRKLSTGVFEKNERKGSWSYWRPDGEIDVESTGVYFQDKLVKRTHPVEMLPSVEPFLDPVDPETITSRLAIEDEHGRIGTLWEAKKWRELATIAEAAIAKRKSDHRWHALGYLARLELGKRRDEANAVALKSLATLGDSPLQLVRFVDKALFVDARTNEYQMALMALTPIAKAGRSVAMVRIAHLRALDGCGNTMGAVTASADLVKDLGEKQDELLDVAEAICDLKFGDPLGDVALRAVDEYLKNWPNARRAILIKYRVLSDLLHRRSQAKAIGLEILDHFILKGLNASVFNLMTQRPTAGRYRRLALLGAELMIERRNLAGFEWDTVALANYLNGRIDKAIEYQRLAIKRDPSDSRLPPTLDVFLAEKKKREASLKSGPKK